MEHKEQINKIKSFIQSNDNFSIFYHLDCDGIISAALLTHVIETMGKSVSSYRPTNYEDFEGMDLSDYTKNIIVCDMQVRDSAIGVFSDRNLCVIDHHELMNADGIAYLNPKMWGDKTYTPCSLVVFRIFEDILKDYDWLATVGLVADSGGKENADFVRSIAGRYNVLLKNDEYLYENDFGKIAGMIGSMTIMHGRRGADEALGIAITSSSLKELMDDERLASASNHVKTRMSELMERFEHEKETWDDFIYFFELGPDEKRYSSTVVTTMSFNEKYYGKILVFMTRINAGLIRLNIRSNGTGVKLPVILREIFKNIKGEGGGHDPAAGGSIEFADKEKFKMMFVKEVYKQLGRS